jgi:hypothetical protein
LKEGVVKLENEYSKVKVNNEIDFCSVTETEAKTVLEKAFMKARVSYFLRWEKPGFFEKLFKNGKTRIVFCINSAQINTADEVIAELGDIDGGVKMLRTKSNNKAGF